MRKRPIAIEVMTIVAVATGLLASGVAQADENDTEPKESLSSPPLEQPPAELEAALPKETLEGEPGAAAAKKLPPAKTPREALVKLEAAARTGDPEQAVPLFAEPFRPALAQAFAAGHLMVDASARLERSVKAKLGPEAAHALLLEKRLKVQLRTPNDGRIEIVSIAQEGERATALIRPRSFMSRGKAEAIDLVLQNGEWKPMPRSRDGKSVGKTELRQMALLSQGLENAAAAVLKLASDIDWGMVNTVPACRERLQEADLEVMKAMMEGHASSEEPPERGFDPFSGRR